MPLFIPLGINLACTRRVARRAASIIHRVLRPRCSGTFLAKPMIPLNAEWDEILA